MSDTADDRPRYPIETRDATLTSVNYAKRIIDVLAVPWEEEAPAMYKGQVWREVFTRGAFDGLEKRPGRVRVNRDHDPQRTVGKMLAAHNASEGLVASLRISQTPLGDETLALADDDVLAPSVAFACGGAGQRFIPNPGKPAGSNRLLDRIPTEHRNALGVRRVLRAFLDHISMETDQAYDGAKVLAVRDASLTDDASPLLTPNLDEWSQYLAERSARVRT